MDPTIDPLATADLLAAAQAAYAAGRAAEAHSGFRAVLAREPDHPKALQKLVWLADHLGSPTEAADLLRRLVAARPADARAWQDLGLCLLRAGQADDAIAALRRATAADPTYAPAFCNLGLALEDRGDVADAIEALEQAPAGVPHAPFIAYHLAALRARAGKWPLGAVSPQAPPPICPTTYLVPLFDGYADRFDEHLFGALGYRGPTLLAEAVAAHAPASLPPPPWDLMDLGCGTGMTAVPFAEAAGWVVGVDLSPRMLARAAARQRPGGRRLYDVLFEQDVTAALRRYREAFHVVLAADVFFYIGDLAAVFAAARAALRPGGLFAFTVESPGDGDSHDASCGGTRADAASGSAGVGGQDYVLRPTRRYAQSAGYVRRLAGEHGFAVADARPADLRLGEDGRPVRGEVWLLRAG